MNDRRKNLWVRYVVVVTYLIMIGVNALANILPINDQTTGQVSDSYQNLFTPAAITFAIWGLIYIMLGVYTVYQYFLLGENNNHKMVNLLEKIGVFFSVSSIANSLWIISWHYNNIVLSMFFMLIILFCLIIINKMIHQENLNMKEKFFVSFPFSIYFGWITVATIANFTVLLVSLGWDGFGISEVTWTVIIIIVGLVISIATILKNDDFIYALAIIWAYLGILIKHISPNGFAGQYSSIIITVGISIVLLIISGIFASMNNKKESR